MTIHEEGNFRARDIRPGDYFRRKDGSIYRVRSRDAVNINLDGPYSEEEIATSSPSKQ